MLVETKLDFNKYLKLNYMLTYRKPIIILITIIGFTLFTGSIFYFLGFNIPVDSPPYTQFLFGFSAIVILPFFIYWNVKKNFYSHGRLQEKIIYEFTDEKIKITGESFNSELDWEKIYKITEFKNWILIYENIQIANILTKESFGEKIKDFRMLIKSKNVNAKLINIK